jgi:hypothetical protein
MIALMFKHVVPNDSMMLGVAFSFFKSCKSFICGLMYKNDLHQKLMKSLGILWDQASHY